MRRAASTCVVVSLVVASSVPPVLACGDKFLVVGRGVAYRRAFASAHPASILLWLPPAPATRDTVKGRLDLERYLRLAGHHVRSVTDKTHLLSELRDGGRYDLVIAGWDDALALAPECPSSVPILPIGNARDDVARQFSAVLDTRDNPEHALSVVDDVLKRASGAHR